MPQYIGKLSPENQRTRVLSRDEIHLLWEVLHTRSPLIAAAYYRLMLSTGQRSIEVLGARHEEIGADNWWTIPAGRVKNKTEHRVWLNEVSRSVLAEIKPHNRNSEYLFPSRDGGHIRWIQKTHGRIRKASGIADFTIHDLRRTAATYMAAAGVGRLTIQKVLNHKEREITAVYDRYGYGPEIQQALDSWSSRLVEILSADAPTGLISRSSQVSVDG